MLRSVSYIRAVAIALVVAAHVQAKWQALSPATHVLDHAVLIFLHGGAIGIFVFVAGFLFHYQQWKRVACCCPEATTTAAAAANGSCSTTSPKNHEDNVEKDDSSSLETFSKTKDLTLPLYMVDPQNESTRREKMTNQHPQSRFWQQRLWKDFDSVRYIKSRIRRIGLPYILICLPILIHRIYSHEEEMGKRQQQQNDSRSSVELVSEKEHWISVTRRIFTPSNLQGIVTSLCHGRDVNYAYWFIPLILLLCCSSPIVVLFLTTFSRRVQVHILVGWYYVVFFLVGGNMGRPPCKDCWWQLVLYFFPMYLSGALLSMYSTTMAQSTVTGRSAKLGCWTLPLSILLAFVLVCQVHLIRLETSVNLDVAAPEPNRSSMAFIQVLLSPVVRQTLHLIQTLLTCGFAWTASHGYNYRKARPAVVHLSLQHLADTGFEIYLFHPWVIRSLDDYNKPWQDQKILFVPRTGWIVWWWETLTVLVISMSLAVVWQRGQQILCSGLHFQCGGTATVRAHSK